MKLCFCEKTFQLLIFDKEKRNFHLFDNEKRIDSAKMLGDELEINTIKWAPLLDVFLVLSSKNLFSLNFSSNLKFFPIEKVRNEEKEFPSDEKFFSLSR